RTPYALSRYLAFRPIRHSFPTRRSSDLRPYDHVPSVAAFRRVRPHHHSVVDDNMIGILNRGVASLETASYPDTAASGRARCVHQDRKSTRLNSSHVKISYAVFCLKKKKD